LPTAIITGSSGLIGLESVRHFVQLGFHVVGLENDMRARFFGPGASTAHVTVSLKESYPEFESLDVDIRDTAKVDRALPSTRGTSSWWYIRPPSLRTTGQRPTR
jgi:CDP-paratose 2-epimerase